MWSEPRRIDSPGDLADLLEELAKAVEEGRLHQVRPGDAAFATWQDVRKLPRNGPWPDYLELHFREAATGRRYKLSVETYHGAGGKWEPEGHCSLPEGR